MLIDHGIRKDLERTFILNYLLYHWDEPFNDIQKQRHSGSK